MTTYVDPDFKTKKELRDAIAGGRHVGVYQPGLGEIPFNGTVYISGPHYPRPHKWYAQGTMENGKLVKIK